MRTQRIETSNGLACATTLCSGAPLFVCSTLLCHFVHRSKCNGRTHASNLLRLPTLCKLCLDSQCACVRELAAGGHRRRPIAKATLLLNESNRAAINVGYLHMQQRSATTTLVTQWHPPQQCRIGARARRQVRRMCVRVRSLSSASCHKVPQRSQQAYTLALDAC